MKRYGCYNLPAARETIVAQDGWVEVDVSTHNGLIQTRVPRMVELPDPMSRGCAYQRDTPNDPACSGCDSKVNHTS